jgi:hypothetical protein
MGEFRTVWDDFTPTRLRDGSAKSAKSPPDDPFGTFGTSIAYTFGAGISAVRARRDPLDDPTPRRNSPPQYLRDRGAKSAKSLPAGYLDQVRDLLSRWVALGRPPLRLSRRLLSGQTKTPKPFVVENLIDYFTTHSLADLPDSGFAPRRPDELQAVAGALAALAGDSASSARRNR